MVRDLVASLFAGDSAALVAHLVSADEVSAGDLAEIRSRLREADATEPAKEAADA